MATYLELYSLGSNNDPLLHKVAIAVVVKAQSYVAGAPTVAQVTWARQALRNPVEESRPIWFAVLAANKSATVAQITGATDAAVQTNVDAIVDKIFASAGV